jgi:ribosome-binding protein aMBF1 (putative translation factor)
MSGADMGREHRKIERTPEQMAELKAVRERFQREKPTRRELEASGEYGPGMPTVTYFAILGFLKQMRELREAAGLSLADMANRTGMDKAFVSRLETGQGNPTVDTLARYAAALGKRVVFGIEEAMDATPKA